MKTKFIKIIKVTLFLAIIIYILDYLSIFVLPRTNFQQQDLLAQEQSGEDIDIAFVGSSSTYRFYDPMTIWGEYEITSIVYGTPSLPFDTTIEIIKSLETSENYSLYVIDLRSLLIDDYYSNYYGSFIRGTTQSYWYESLVMLPTSLSKINYIYSSDYIDDSEYIHIFDVLYYHDSFVSDETVFIDCYELESYTFNGSGRLSLNVEDTTSSYVDFYSMNEDDNYTLNDDTISRLTEILEYGTDNNLNMFFTFTPYVGQKNTCDANIIRELTEIVEDYGYPCENYKEQFEEIGLDTKTDFYDRNHTNLYGAQKFTSYSMQDIILYLDEETNYSQEQIDSWNATYEEWINGMDEYTASLDEMIAEILADYE